MGSVCKKQNQEESEISNLSPKAKQKKVDTITIPNNSAGTHASQKHSTNKGEADEIQQKPDIEPKRVAQKKQVKIEARLDHEEIFENVRKSDKVKSPFDYQLILNAFGTNNMFSSLQQTDQEIIIDKMFYCTTPDGQFVFKQGDKASSFFLIERGQCQIIIDNDLKKTLKMAEYFGERALLYNAPRSASVKAVGDCAFWAIDRNIFQKMVEDIRVKEFEENKQFITNVKFFDFLTDDQRNAISNVLFTMVFKKGELIVTEGEVATSFFIIKKGSVLVLKGDKEIRKMTAGESFGEQALFQNSTRGATVKANEEEVKCLVITRDELTKILGDKIQVVMYRNRQIWAIERNPILGKLTDLQIQKIVQNTNQFNYESGQVVFEETITKLLIVLEGELIFAQSKKVAAAKGQLFGDEHIDNPTLGEPIVTNGKSILAEIDYKRVQQCIGGALDAVIRKNHITQERQLQKHKESQKDYSQLRLEDMVAIKKLGQGQFGNVYLVKNKDNHLYALKCISKHQIIEQHLERHLAQEKQVLASVHYPFLMRFYRSFSDANYIYFLVEYIKGMELFDVIRDIGLLNIYDTQFYVASLILCIEYMNKHNIVYRDIKPENIMVDDKGYMRLIDMGTAKFLTQKSGRTYTIIGTPHYMAPEILMGKGYSFPVDLWSIGVCMYEFMCGCVPYAEEAEDPYEIYEEIQKKALSYPAFLKDRKSKKLIDQLLQKTPELRLGGSYASLKAHSWFDLFDWDKLLEKEMKPFYVPAQNKTQKEGSLIQNGRSVQQELAAMNLPAYKREKAKDPNWDRDY